jgi:hypothetical protein
MGGSEIVITKKSKSHNVSMMFGLFSGVLGVRYWPIFFLLKPVSRTDTELGRRAATLFSRWYGTREETLGESPRMSCLPALVTRFAKPFYQRPSGSNFFR